MNSFFIVQEDMNYNNFEIRGISTDFNEIALLFDEFVALGKPTLFELIRLDVTGAIVKQTTVLRSTS